MIIDNLSNSSEEVLKGITAIAGIQPMFENNAEISKGTRCMPLINQELTK